MRSPNGTRHERPVRPTAYLLMITFRVWLLEIPLAAVNAFVLMDRVYAPRVGALAAHQIAMGTRIVWVLVLAYAITYFSHGYRPRTLLLSGLFWMTLWLVFEWAGSLLIGRPVGEILVGWHVERGYLWPYVLLTYLLAPLAIGTLLHPARSRGPARSDEPRRPVDAAGG